MIVVAFVKLDGTVLQHQLAPGKSLVEVRVKFVHLDHLDLSKLEMDTTRRFSMKSLVDLVNSESLSQKKK